MSINSVLEAEVEELFDADYDISSAHDIPAISEIGLGNVGTELELAMLFIDIHESTAMVDGFRRQTAAKMYKAFLRSVVRMVNARNGHVLSFNGDGVLAGFDGTRKCNNAVEAALGMSWFIEKTLRPRMQNYFDNNNELNDMVFDYGLGIDVGDVLVVRGGVRGEQNNDLVWVGNATNLAVKLAALGRWPHNIYVGEIVYDPRLLQENKVSRAGVSMWEKMTWNALDGRTIYRSAWMREM